MLSKESLSEELIGGNGHGGLSETCVEHEVELAKLKQRVDRINDHINLLPAMSQQLGTIATSLGYLHESTNSVVSGLASHLESHRITGVQEATDIAKMRLVWPGITLVVGLVVGALLKILLGV